MNAQSDKSGCFQPTATIIAALIGLLGVLATGYLSYRAGIEKTSNEVEDRLSTKDGTIAELKQMLDERDATIRDLRAARTQPSATTPPKQEHIQDSAPKPPPSRTQSTVREAPGLRVELLPCRFAGDELKCEFRATSTDHDKEVYLRYARLIESDASEVWPVRMQFASSVSEGDHSPGSATQVYAEMVRGIAIGGSVVFSGVDPAAEAEGIPLIELSFDGLDAQFRNIRPK